MPQKTKYPNIPEDFAKEMRRVRNEKRLTLKEVCDGTGISHPPMLSDYERETRNIPYEVAIKIRDFLEMDFHLPEPDMDSRTPVFRRRFAGDLKKDSFFIEVDGQLIRVLTWRDYGPVKKAKVVEE